MTRNINIPTAFYDDRINRSLPVPVAVRETKRAVWVSLDDPEFSGLESDAKWYASLSFDRTGDDPAKPMIVAARALLRAIDRGRALVIAA